MNTQLKCLIAIAGAFWGAASSFAQSPYLFSSMASGQSAYVAASQPGMRFIHTNPALLAFPSGERRYQLTSDFRLEAMDRFFHDNFSDFGLRYQVSHRFAIAVEQMTASTPPQITLWKLDPESTNHIPLPNLYLDNRDDLAPFLHFSWQQNWTFGAGWMITPDLSVGINLKRLSYDVHFASSVYWASDIGIQYAVRPNLRIALTGRNMLRHQTQDAAIVYSYEKDGSRQYTHWEPSAFPAAITKPPRFAEAGFAYTVRDRFELLGDVSTRKEFAWGLRWRCYRHLYLTGGESHRYDGIYRKQMTIANHFGIQLITDRWQLAFSAVSPTRYDYDGAVNHTQYGPFRVEPVPQKSFRAGVSFSF